MTYILYLTFHGDGVMLAGCIRQHNAVPTRGYFVKLRE